VTGKGEMVSNEKRGDLDWIFISIIRVVRYGTGCPER